MIRWKRPRQRRAVAERDLLAARREQRSDEPLAARDVARDDPLEQALEILEEAGLALLDADERPAVRRVDVRDAVRAARSARPSARRRS